VAAAEFPVAVFEHGAVVRFNQSLDLPPHALELLGNVVELPMSERGGARSEATPGGDVRGLVTGRARRDERNESKGGFK